MSFSRRAMFAQLAVASFVNLLLTRNAGAADVIYTYDDLGRLTSATYADGSSVTYSYDSAGNRLIVASTDTTGPNGTFTSNPATINAGQSSTLSWTSTNATGVSINNGVGSVTPVASGSISVSPTTTTTYTATITGPAGTITRTATVTVNTGFTQTIQVSGTAPINLRTLANNAGYNGAQNATITFEVNSGTTVTGAAGGGVAIDSGTWPTGSHTINLTLLVKTNGKVHGGGGAGGGGIGSGGPGGGINAGAGGDAIYCRLPMSVTVQSGGEISGGGGGGGGGLLHVVGSQFGTVQYGGGGGGGGFPNGAGGGGGAGSGGGGNGTAGASGTTSGGGAGGAGATGAGAGGNGGNAGSAGASGNVGSTGGSLPSGGAAGYAIRKNGNTVPVTNNGTITGTQG